MDDPQQPQIIAPPAPPPVTGRAPVPHRAPVGLVVSCILLGVLAAWGWTERRNRLDWAERFRLFKLEQTWTLSRRAELADFVAQPATRLLHLAGQDEARGLIAAIAWNPDLREGSLFFGPLPPLANQQTYQIWAVVPDQPQASAASGGTFGPSPDAGVFTFHLGRAGPPPDRFLITAEPPGGADHPGAKILFKGENL